MFFQRILARIDDALSEIFWLSSCGNGDRKDGRRQWTYFIHNGRTIGIVGADGKIHTMMGYWAVHHYYENGELVKRIPVRKDLKTGERLATKAEIAQHQEELRGLFANRHAGFICT